MKIVRNISAATEGSVEPSETMVYKIDLKELIELLKRNKENIITIWQLENEGVKSINFDKGLWGSGHINDTLYLMKTDGRDILIEGKNVNPEEVFDDIEEGKYDISVLDPYIQDNDEKFIRLAISPDVMNAPEFEDAALDLLAHYSLLDVVEAAEEYDDFRE